MVLHSKTEWRPGVDGIRLGVTPLGLWRSAILLCLFLTCSHATVDIRRNETATFLSPEIQDTMNVSTESAAFQEDNFSLSNEGSMRELMDYRGNVRYAHSRGNGNSATWWTRQNSRSSEDRGTSYRGRERSGQDYKESARRSDLDGNGKVNTATNRGSDSRQWRSYGWDKESSARSNVRYRKSSSAAEKPTYTRTPYFKYSPQSAASQDSRTDHFPQEQEPSSNQDHPYEKEDVEGFDQTKVYEDDADDWMEDKSVSNTHAEDNDEPDLEQVLERLTETDEEYPAENPPSDSSVYSRSSRNEYKTDYTSQDNSNAGSRDDRRSRYYQWRSGNSEESEDSDHTSEDWNSRWKSWLERRTKDSGETAEDKHPLQQEVSKESSSKEGEEQKDSRHWWERYKQQWHEGQGRARWNRTSSHRSNDDEAERRSYQPSPSTNRNYTRWNDIYSQRRREWNSNTKESGSGEENGRYWRYWNRYDKKSSAEKESSDDKESGYDKKSSAEKESSYAKKSSAYKESSYAKKSSAYKESSYAKKSSAYKESSYAKKSSAYKESSYAKKSSAYKESSYAKKSSAYKESSYAKKSSAYKESSYAKKSSAYKESSYAKKSSAYKESSYAKKSSAYKESSYAKKSSSNKSGGESENDSRVWWKQSGSGSSRHWYWFCSKKGERCNAYKRCCKHQGLTCTSGKCCSNRDQTCQTDNECCSEMICKDAKCTVACCKTGEECSAKRCCEDKSAVCSFSPSRSKNVCCKEGNISCNSDKECCRGRCLYKEDNYGNRLIQQGKMCTEDQTCATQNRKTTKEYCEKDSDCCGSAQVLKKAHELDKGVLPQGHHSCKDNHCCRPLDSECEDDQSCCSKTCKDHRCAEKPCIPISRPCISDAGEASCCHATVTYDQEKRKVPATCTSLYLENKAQHKCCITDGNYCASSDQCCPDHECISQLDSDGKADDSQPKVCGIPPPPPCKHLGEYCDSASTCCKLPSTDPLTDPVELECASVVDRTLDIIIGTNSEDGVVRGMPIPAPKCCIPELKHCSVDQECCGVAKCGYLHRRYNPSRQWPNKTCFDGNKDTCCQLGHKCSNSEECCMAEILISNSVHYIPLTCAASTGPGYGISHKKSCCISKGQLCDDSASCCGPLECSHPTNLLGQKLLHQPKVCREPIKEPCKDIGDTCASHTQCCEASIQTRLSVSKVKPLCDKISSITTKVPTENQRVQRYQRGCCLGENEVCNDHSQCCGDSRCAVEAKNGSPKCWIASKRCISKPQPACKPLNQECKHHSDCCITPVSIDDDLFFAYAKCQGPRYTLLQSKGLLGLVEPNQGTGVGNKGEFMRPWFRRMCCLEKGTPCSSNDQCCLGFTCRKVNGRQMCAPLLCSSIGEDCNETQKCCQLHEQILDTPVCKHPFQTLKPFPPKSLPNNVLTEITNQDTPDEILEELMEDGSHPENSKGLQVSRLSYFAPMSFCCVPEGQICLRSSDCCDHDATCGHPSQTKTELWTPGQEPRRCYIHRCREVQEACDFNSECCEEDTVCSTCSKKTVQGTRKQCCKVKGSVCENSEDCCLGKCYQEENHFGVILTSEKKCLDNTCQESGQVATGAPCTQASDCCGHEKGAHDCPAGRCCRPVGQSCSSGEDCCTEFCHDGVCSEKHCMYAGQSCTLESKSEECCFTSIWTPDGDLETPSSCGLAHASFPWDEDRNIPLTERRACCFEEGVVCNDDSQCCFGTHCVYENDHFGTKLTNIAKKCLKNTCIVHGKHSSGEYCTSKEDCCGSKTGLQDCVGKTCCRIDGKECESDGHCCGKSICQADDSGHKTCQQPPCVSLGHSCNQDSTCCVVTNQHEEVKPQCHHGTHSSNQDFFCCFPEGFDCSSDFECCAGSKCVIPTDQYGFPVFEGGHPKRTKCLTDRCALGYAKPPGHDCYSQDECCGSDAGIQDCRGQCCIKDDWKCEHSHHCCNGYCDPTSKVCVDPSCRSLGVDCIPTLQHSCCKTVIHESLEDVVDESTKVFPDNTLQRYQNMNDEDLPKTGLVKKEGPDGSWMLHHTPVAVEVLPVCRATQGVSYTKPKCCIEYGLRCQSAGDCCQYQEGDSVDCVYQKDQFGVEVHVWGKFCLRSEDLCEKQGTNEVCTKDADCCGCTYHGKNGDILQKCLSGRCCRTNSNKCYHNSQCCSGYCDLAHSVCREPPCVHIGHDCTSYSSVPNICCKVDVFAPSDPYNPVDWVMPTCFHGSSSGYSCCMREGEKCNTQSDCCKNSKDLICEVMKDAFGVVQYNSPRTCIKRKHWCDLKSTGEACSNDHECCGYDQSSSGEARQRCYEGRCCKGLDQSCEQESECCTNYCDPDSKKCATEPCTEEGEVCHSGNKCCDGSECHHQRDVFGMVLIYQPTKCTANKCPISHLAAPVESCSIDEDCCQGTTMNIVQECGEDHKCCVVEKQHCAFDEQCCSDYCDPESKICTQPPCRTLGEDCSDFSNNPQICCPMKISRDKTWEIQSFGDEFFRKRPFVQPSCQPVEAAFNLGCCLALNSPCLQNSDCCQLSNRPVSCMEEIDYFGLPIDRPRHKKRCLISNDYCNKRKTGDLCIRDEDCCGHDSEDGVLQRCKKRDKSGPSRCCKIMNQECSLDEECCTGHCDLWTHTCKIATCTKLGEECTAEPACCPVAGRSERDFVEPVCIVVGFTRDFLADAKSTDQYSTYWKQCCLQIGDYCRTNSDCCGYAQNLAECSTETSICIKRNKTFSSQQG